MPANHRSATATQPQDGQSSSPASNASSSEQQEDTTEETGPSDYSKANTAPTALNEQKTTPTVSLVETNKSSISNEGQVMQIDSVPPAATEIAQEVILEEAVRVTRAKSRKTRAASNR